MSRRPALLAVLTAVLAAPASAPAQGLVDGPIEAAYAPPFAHSGPVGRQAVEGPWAVKLDPGANGEAKGWHTGAFTGRPVTAPHVPNATPLTGEAGVRGFRGTVAWFRTGFKVPADGEYAIRFESVHHKADVWLDGRRLMRHTGVYLPFERKATLRAGHLYTLVVRADYRGPTAQKRAGWHRTWFNFGGLNREVTIRPVGPSELSAPEVTTRLRPDGSASVDVSVHVRNRAESARRIPVAGVLSRGDQRIELRFPELEIPPRTTRIVHAVADVDRPALWEPGAPNLYDLDLSVPGEAAYRQRIGLRELTWRGSRMFLNGRRLKLHGASLHEDVMGRGDGLRPADMDALVAQLKAIGANATRSQHQLHPALVERLDAAGILLWMGLGPVDAPGAWTNKTRAQAASARRRVRRTYFQLQAHPSIIAWNLANEVAGNGHPDGQAAFIDTMARELHRRDPGRMTAVDVWGAHPPRGRLGRMYRNLDAIAVTNYAGWYEEPLAPRARQAQLIRTTTASFLRTFRGKVTVISEFGAEANDLNPASRPGGYGFQSALLRRHIETYRDAARLSGMLVWNLRDFAVSPAFAGGSIRRLVPGIRIVRGINTKGLFDLDGQPKPAVTTVSQLFGPLGTGMAPVSSSAAR